METPSTELIAIHLAVLADAAGGGAERLCGVLAYDGRGRRHLHALAAATPPDQLRELLDLGGPCQLQLPFAAAAPAANSGGRTWRSRVLPTIPSSLRALPPELLAAAVADHLAGPTAGQTTGEVVSLTAVIGPESTPLDQRRARAQTQLDGEPRRIVDSGEYAAWFAKLAVFRRCAPTNAMWILGQAPQATKVASYRTWQQLGRQVGKGEAGIMVFHPKPYWMDPATGQRVRAPRTDADRRRLEQRTGFGVGHFFDIAQTDGDPLPELGRPAPVDAPQALSEHLGAWRAEHHVTVATRQLPPGLFGYYQRDSDQIVLASDITLGERVATLAHEFAHRQDPELLHAEGVGDRSYYTRSRPDCEAVAEAAAHAISARFGHDTTGHAAGYIAGWVDGDVDRLVALQGRVGKVTATSLPPDQLDLALDAARQQAASASRTPVRGRR